MDEKSFLAAKSSSVPVYKDNYYKTLFSKLFKKPIFIICLFIIVAIFIISFSISLIVDADAYTKIDFDNAFIAPNSTYIFGTNEFGQNFFYLTMIGTANTIKLAFVASIINLFLGTIIGIIWGYYSKIDNLMIFIRNIFNNIPLSFVYIIVISAIGSGFFSIILIITILGWVDLACLVRNNLIIIRNKDYNVYSTLNHVPFYKIAINNYLPHLLPIIFCSFAISFPEATALETTITYFGFSLGKANISLGLLLHDALTSNNWLNNTYLFLIPFLIIFIINTCFFYIGKTFHEISTKEDKSCLK